jgi:hypothetical protein
MGIQQENKIRPECQQSMERIQQFEPTTLAREGDLGLEFSFKEVVPQAARLISLYNQVSLVSLEDFPESQLGALKTRADADYNRFEEILKFSAKQTDAYNTRNNLITQMDSAYQNAFNVLHPMIAYSTSKSADFKRLETQARAMIQGIEDNATDLTKKLEEDKKTSEQILAAIRDVAGERGVSQQAFYFNQAAQDHEGDATKWQNATIVLACVLGIYAILTIFLHKIPWIAPANLYETIQLAISKVLIFAVLSYVLYISTKNYLAQKHNAVINKHRQNALMTYEALVDAAKDIANKEVILTHASACIFAPQPTGYTSNANSDGPVAKSAVELLSTTMRAGK